MYKLLYQLVALYRPKSQTKKSKKSKGYQEKTVHGRFPKIFAAKSDSEMWLKLQAGNLKRMTESLLVAAQEQVLRTNWVKQSRFPMYVMHINRGRCYSYSKGFCVLLQKKCRKRYEKPWRVIHWELG